MVLEVALMKENVLRLARSYIGVKQGDARHGELIRKYNAVRPLPVGYKVKTSDNWCAAFVTVIGDLAGVSGLIGRECGVHRFKKIFKDKGIWLGSVNPRPGDIVIFDWQKNGWTDHIGFVEQVKGNQMVTIEGNTSRSVTRRTYAYKDWRVAGFARPKYSGDSAVVADGKKSVSAVAKEVVAGKWSNGDERVRRLKSAGYDVGLVQKEVNRLVKGRKSYEEIAKEVVRGHWGNGANRKKQLSDAGYDYGKVQKIVNKMI